MAYKTDELFKQAKEAIEKHKLFFIEDIVAFLPCHKSTFYEHFPNESDNYRTLFEMLEKNRTELKVSLRHKWFKSDNASLQMGLMKLICTDEERKKLSLQYTQNEEVNSNHLEKEKAKRMTDEELEAEIKKLSKKKRNEN